MKDVTDQNFDASVLKSTGLSMVDFWAEWCAPCHALSPTLEALEKEYQGKVSLFKINADENPDSSATYNVRGLPTVIFFRDGKEVHRVVGNVSKAKMKDAIDKTLTAS